MFRSSNFFSISYISCVRHTFGLELRFLCYYHHRKNKLGSNRLTHTSFFWLKIPLLISLCILERMTRLTCKILHFLLPLCLNIHPLLASTFSFSVPFLTLDFGGLFMFGAVVAQLAVTGLVGELGIMVEIPPIRCGCRCI